MKLTDSKKKNSIPIKKYIALFVALFVVGLLFFFEHFYEEPISLSDVQVTETFEEEKSSVGYRAPQFTLRNLEGNHVSLESFRGQVVVLNFWATWCVPCRIEMPSFEHLYRRYRSEGLTVLAVSLDKGADQKVRDFSEEYQLSFPVLIDSEGKAEKLYPSISIPFTFVIDKSGRVVARVDGAKNWESEETFEAIEHLLKHNVER
jgi:peroxiredoxin